MTSLHRRSLLALAAASPFASARAQELKGGTLRVGVLQDVVSYDPQAFSTVNFPVIKQLYDTLIEYTPDGKPIPSLASAWQIAPDATSVTVTLRPGVKFQSGNPVNAKAVVATLEKAADPKRGKNVYATMSVVKGWTAVDDGTVRLDFKNPAPQQQITDLLQFISVIDPAGMDTVETKPAGTGAYMLADRVVGQKFQFTANPNYWRPGEPVAKELVITVF